MNSEQIVKNLQRYFNAKIIGSYIFVEKGMLKIDDINDIDVIVHPDNIENVYKYLEDFGYKQTIRMRDGDFEKKNELRIDVVKSVKNVFSVATLIAEKFKRGSETDIEQLLKIMKQKYIKI